METNSTPDELPLESSGETPPPPTESAPELLPAEAREESATEQPPGDSEPETTEPAADGAVDELSDLVTRSQAARLPAADEEQMGALLKAAMLGGKSGVAKAVEHLPKLPWIVGVRAVESVWPEMKVTARTQLLKGLADDESEGARRIRLSLARALWKIDPPTALKLAVGVCKEIRDKETGALSQRNGQIFSNVFIGKVKPWIAQIALAELKPAEADVLVQTAILAVFSLPHPPVTQLGVLKWAGEAGKLEKLQETTLDPILRSVSRWSGKWQGALRKEVANLPENIASALKPATTEPDAQTSADGAQDEEPVATGEDGAPGESRETATTEEPRPIKQRPVYEPRPQRPPAMAAAEPADAEPDRERSREGDRENDRERDRGRDRGRGRDRERPVYQPRGGGSAGQNFNLNEALRQIEAHVQTLRSELNTAQAKLVDENRPSRRAAVDRGPVIPGEHSPEELARLNLQLESRITELQQRITDLLADAEDRAASMGAHGEQQVTDPDQQLKTLLGFKLQEDFADYLALQDESTGVVVQQHYRSLLGHIFEVLQAEGVTLKA